ncbi:hypothetical protein [Stenotrophomonas sp.]|uniref:hypothetical protein n=1 Tax=Stenotrophomonas sp. TaxID=69392 RepID=UPI00289DB4B2|nr:hypothetical protein [Stenotrophomonas sp.]
MRQDVSRTQPAGGAASATPSGSAAQSGVPARAGSQQVWFILHGLLVAPLLLLAALCGFLMVLFVMAHGRSSAIQEVIVVFVVWSVAVGVSALGLLRLGRAWVCHDRPLSHGDPGGWRFLLATLLAQFLLWGAIVHIGIGFGHGLFPGVLFLIPSVPAGGCAAHLAWLRHRDIAGNRPSGT